MGGFRFVMIPHDRSLPLEAKCCIDTTTHQTQQAQTQTHEPDESTASMDQVVQFMMQQKKLEYQARRSTMNRKILVGSLPLLRISPSLPQQEQQQQQTNNIGMTAYYFEESQGEGYPNIHLKTPNIRATSLAMSVGQFHLRFYGNVYIAIYQKPQQQQQLTNENGNICTHTQKFLDLNISDIEAACMTPDLRPEIVERILLSSSSSQKEEETKTKLSTPPFWLANGMRENYKDKENILKFANVMKGKQQKKREGTEKDDDSSGSDDEDEQEKNSNNKNNTPQASISFDTPLCFHCRTPCNELCPDCNAVYLHNACKTDGWSHYCYCPTWNIYASQHRQLLSSFPFFFHTNDNNESDHNDVKKYNVHQLLTPENYSSEKPYALFLKRIGVCCDDEDNHADGFLNWWSTEIGGWWTKVNTNSDNNNTVKMNDPFVRMSYQDGFGKSLSSIGGSERPFIPLEPFTTSLSSSNSNVNNDITKISTHFKRCPYTNMIQLYSWKDYYDLRNISLKSPVSLLLTFPLTLYYAIQQYGTVPLYVSNFLSTPKKPLRVHVVGIEKEINFLDIFKEVAYLCGSDILIELCFVIRRDMLPRNNTTSSSSSSSTTKLSGCSYSYPPIQLAPNLTLYLVPGTYGTQETQETENNEEEDEYLNPNFDVGSGGPPDMIIGMNAGLYAYESWRSVIKFLEFNRNVIGVFTDYNEHSAVNCAGILPPFFSSEEGKTKSARETVQINPFRQPRTMAVR